MPAAEAPPTSRKLSLATEPHFTNKTRVASGRRCEEDPLEESGGGEIKLVVHIVKFLINGPIIGSNGLSIMGSKGGSFTRKRKYFSPSFSF